MKCSAKCETDAGDEAFCEEHWRSLPRWARQEILRLKKQAQRGSGRGMREYGMACAAAAHLISTASKALAATE